MPNPSIVSLIASEISAFIRSFYSTSNGYTNYFNKLANTDWQNARQCRISHQTWPVTNNKKTSELLKFSRT